MMPAFASGQWPITELRPAQCRFICTPHYGPRNGHRCCGEPTTGPGSSYCEAHRAIVYRSGMVEINEPEAEEMAA